MITGLRSIARERAEAERDRLLFESFHDMERIKDMFIQEGYIDLDDMECCESGDDDINRLIDQLPESDDIEDDEQIGRILSAEDDIDVEQMLATESVTI